MIVGIYLIVHPSGFRMHVVPCLLRDPTLSHSWASARRVDSLACVNGVAGSYMAYVSLSCQGENLGTECLAGRKSRETLCRSSCTYTVLRTSRCLASGLLLYQAHRLQHPKTPAISASSFAFASLALLCHCPTKYGLTTSYRHVKSGVCRCRSVHAGK